MTTFDVLFIILFILDYMSNIYIIENQISMMGMVIKAMKTRHMESLEKL